VADETVSGVCRRKQQFALQFSQDEIRGIRPALALDSEETADFAAACSLICNDELEGLSRRIRNVRLVAAASERVHGNQHAFV
jgi:hypothetical protein